MTDKNTRGLGVVDLDTGEMLDEGKLIYVPQRPRMKRGWFMAMQEGFKLLSKEPLRGESMRVLLFIMGVLDFENHIDPTNSCIAEALGMRKQNVSRAMKELKERSIVIDAPYKRLRLESSYGWRGKVRTLRAHQNELLQQQQREDRRR